MTCDDARDLAPSFVLGALEADDEAAVREHLATCAEPHPEFEELGSVIPALVETIDLVEPPAALRTRIMAAAAQDLAERQGALGIASPTTVAPITVAPTTIAPTASTQSTAPAVPTAASERTAPSATIDLAAARESRRPSRVAWLAGIAAVIAIVALGAWNVRLNSDLDAAVAYRDHVGDVLAVAAKPGSSSAILTSKDDLERSGLAAVASDGSVHIVMRGLGANTGTTVYTAWVIDSTGPTAIGSFTVGSDGLGYLTTPAGPGTAGVTVALTLEPVSGDTKPAGPVVSSGVVGS